MQFFNRCWQLKIKFANGKTKIYQKLDSSQTGLAITFRCDAVASPIPPGGTITIANLTNEDVNYLGTVFRAGRDHAIPTEVEFSAGYDGTLSIILIGNVLQSTMNYSDGGSTVQLTVVNGMQANQINRYLSISFQDTVTLRDILANLANANSWTLDFDSSLSNRVLTDYSYQGSPDSQLQNLNSYFSDITITRINHTLSVKQKGTQGTVKYKLSHSTGLLKNPQPTPQGVILTTYLLSNLYVHDFIELESQKIPQLNGVYQVIQLSHEGNTRGDAWYSKITCSPPGFYTES